jgi:hypothetical protein
VPAPLDVSPQVRPADTIPPRRGYPLGSTGFATSPRPYGTFAAGQRIWIGTFYTPDEAARAYNAVVWRFDCIRSELNFPKVESAEKAQFLALPPLLETCEERCNHERAVRRISIAEVDERLMAEHRTFIQRMWRGRRSFGRRRSMKGGWRAQRRGGRRLGLRQSTTTPTRSSTTRIRTAGVQIYHL